MIIPSSEQRGGSLYFVVSSLCGPKGHDFTTTYHSCNLPQFSHKKESEFTTVVRLGSDPGKSCPQLRLSNTMAYVWFHVKQNEHWWNLGNQIVRKTAEFTNLSFLFFFSNRLNFQYISQSCDFFLISTSINRELFSCIMILIEKTHWKIPPKKTQKLNKHPLKYTAKL